ncbi:MULTISPECIES: carbohydrate ABC transporter permease [Brevibacillus]|jgi:multiple sugar transport system permease protein|uniref:Binding-protein-dependent transport systems inner membrane component n=1 Tax=Brevibacillus borstelensis AK1 TaxID=1300222 RepID=M8DX13_9BACL|nr:sugar ABC transporter permease [Brevibacillus borstelensis]EMT51546.1 binding-protein-dependent transport systems inner membrane component [Brevibacillus borstelensis AK1]KKX56542.1 ABC transporter permease [Brevibacillus borstelensis cifa_chp40]MBE5395353.1 sugar ABC transporter permease [Brevibacillus borstelensis]MCC0562805.1 sugar ABC transporter permease [Brevibacillus borstelensis]MCM3468729.1 sugar ABC transporter permease [Brevibacillus borstelensis]
MNQNTQLTGEWKTDERPVPKPRKRKRLDSEGRWGILLISPYLIHLIVFVAFTSIASLYISFTDYDMLNPPEWTGLANYSKMIDDPLFWKALKNTLYFTILLVPIKTALALVLAVALNQKLKGLKLYRIAHFIPVISSWTVIAYVADSIFNPRFGWANSLLVSLGLEPKNWLADEQLVIPVLVAVAIWKGVGYMMVLFLAGLQNVPGDLYEAAEIDGAGPLQKFWRITVPLISGTTFLVLILSTISSFQSFEQIYVMTAGAVDGVAGGPNNASLVLMLHLYREGFTFFHMGYASAIAWVLFLILFVFTFMQMRLQKRWVHYD